MKKVFLGMCCAAFAVACGTDSADTPALNQNEAVSVVEITDETDDGCRRWNASLSACQPYRCVYVSRGGAVMGREVLGEKDGKCAYYEQLPGSKLLRCHLAQGDWQDMAQYYQRAEVKENVSLSVMQLADGTVEYQEIIDGEPVRTPLQKALSSGACRITALPADPKQTPQMLELQFGEGKETETIVL